MTIREKISNNQHNIIDLTGPQGNAFFLLAAAKDYSRQLGLNFNQINSEMISGDYEHLIQTFDKHFGHFVILER